MTDAQPDFEQIAQERLKLIRALNKLPLSQFLELEFAINVPVGVMPAVHESQGIRSRKLLDWVEGPTGCGLSLLLKTLKNDLGVSIFERRCTTSKTTAKSLTFVLAGSIEEIDAATLRAIANLLRQKSGDINLQIEYMEEGSIKLKLSGTPQGLKRLKKSVDSGSLQRIIDIPVKRASFNDQMQSFLLLEAVIEGFVDGVLILSEHGTLLRANAQARRLFHQLSLGPKNKSAEESEFVPPEIRHICDSLLNSIEVLPDPSISNIPEMEVTLTNSVELRVRAQRLKLDGIKKACLVVTLEDQSKKNLIISDIKKYGLTNREAEVWQLRRANRTYKEIATQLHITLNMVKKHMSNILAKRKAAIWAEESDQEDTISKEKNRAASTDSSSQATLNNRADHPQKSE